MNNEQIAILGAGNGGCAIAGSLALGGASVRLFNRTPARLEQLRAKGGILVTGVTGCGFAYLDMITTNIRDAIVGADFIVIVVPTSALSCYAKLLASYVQPEQIILLNPGHTCGGLYLVNLLRQFNVMDLPPICETVTLTHASRMTAPDAVDIRLLVRNMPFSAFPGHSTPYLLERFINIFPNLVSAKNVIHTALMNINAIQHPAQALCNAGWLEFSKGDYLFYHDGTGISIGRLIDAVDQERMEIARKYGLEVSSFVEIFHSFGFTTDEGLKGGTAFSALKNSPPNRWTKGPSTGLDHRYIHEDVGYGLVPMVYLAEKAGVSTPNMNALITLASTMNQIDYRSEGLSLAKIGLDAVEISEMDNFLSTGLSRGSR